MHHARQSLRDLVRPCVQQRQHGLVARLSGGKDGTTILPCRVFLLRSAYQSGGGGVALPAALCAAGAIHAVQRVGAVVSQLAAQTPRAFQQTTSGQDAAAHASAQRHADDVRIALCTADPHLAQRHAVGVVGYRDRQAKGLFQFGFNRCADVVGQAAAGARHDALAAVDLTGGRHADARKAFRRDALRGKEGLCSLQHRGQDGGAVAVKAYALLSFRQHRASLVHDAQLDGCAADVDTKIVFHSRHSPVLFFAALMAPVKRAVISAGRVMAPPTTSAKAPASSALTACSG